MMKIAEIKAREILDSRGNPTRFCNSGERPQGFGICSLRSFDRGK